MKRNVVIEKGVPMYLKFVFSVHDLGLVKMSTTSFSVDVYVYWAKAHKGSQVRVNVTPLPYLNYYLFITFSVIDSNPQYITKLIYTYSLFNTDNIDVDYRWSFATCRNMQNVLIFLFEEKLSVIILCNISYFIISNIINQ